MTEEIQIIRGGWGNVPSHLKCKTDLAGMGLRPSGPVKAQVWNHYNWIDLYDLQDAVPKRKPTARQLEALEQGRQKQREQNTCPVCRQEVGLQHLISQHEGMMCTWCHEKERVRKLQARGQETFQRWHEEDFIILDTETTGLDEDAEIIEIALIDRNGQVLLDTLVSPIRNIPEESKAIHGIDEILVASAPKWPDIWPTLQGILKDRKVLIYNADFDTRMINQTCLRWGVEPIKLNTECVMRAYAKYIGSDRWLKLTDAADIFTTHRACGDCKAVLKVLRDVWRNIGLEEKAV